MDAHLPVMPSAVKADEDPEGRRRPGWVSLIAIEANLRAAQLALMRREIRVQDHQWLAPTLFSLRRDIVRRTAGQSFVWSGRLAS